MLEEFGLKPSDLRSKALIAGNGAIFLGNNFCADAHGPIEEKLREIVGKQAELVTTTIKTANTVFRDIKHRAIEEGTTISEVITKALKDYLEREKKRGR